METFYNQTNPSVISFESSPIMELLNGGFHPSLSRGRPRAPAPRSQKTAHPDFVNVFTDASDSETRLHYLLKFILKSNQITPVVNPRRVLDVGCGAGIWSVEMAMENPSCEVVGIDIAPPKETFRARFSKNITYKSIDIRQRLDFEDNTFDVVHLRGMGSVIDPAKWNGLLCELRRVLVPGGWIQLVEADWVHHCDHPAVETMNKWSQNLASSLYKNLHPLYFRDMDVWARDSGFHNVAKKTIDIPVGEWGKGSDLVQIGFLNLDYNRSLFKCLKDYMTAVNSISSDEYDKVAFDVLKACQDNKGFTSFIVVCAQKPPSVET